MPLQLHIWIVFPDGTRHIVGPGAPGVAALVGLQKGDTVSIVINDKEHRGTVSDKILAYTPLHDGWILNLLV